MTAPSTVPGDPAALRVFARELVEFGNRLDTAGNGLKGIDADAGWAGESGDAFRARFEGFAGRWHVAGQAFQDVSTAVTRYADVLEWAQRRAVDVDRQHTDAAAASRSAAEAYIQNTARGVAQPPFVDPGIGARQAAADSMQDAHSQLVRAGDEAADAIIAATGTAPKKPFWNRVGDGIVEAAGEAGAVGSAIGQTIASSPGSVVAAGAGAAAVAGGIAGVLGGGAVSLTGAGAVAGIPAVAASGALVAGGLATIGAATMDVARKAEDTYSRPSGHRKGVRDTTYNNAKGADGKVRDPGTGKEIKKGDKWDMGHKPGQEFRRHQQDARERGISREEFLDEHNDPDRYRPETPNTNRSHRLEKRTDDFEGD